MIRPDHFRLHDGSEAAPVLRGTVTDTTYLGEYTQVAVTTSWGAPLSVRLPRDGRVSRPVERGQPSALTCVASKLRIF